jgi:hypothetical protein
LEHAKLRIMASLKYLCNIIVDANTAPYIWPNSIWPFSITWHIIININSMLRFQHFNLLRNPWSFLYF